MKFSIKEIIKKLSKKNSGDYINDECYQKGNNSAKTFVKQLKIEEKVIGDRKNGIIEKYSKGKLLSQTPYCDGRVHGKVYTYFEDGSVESIQTYKNGVLNGMSIVYDRRGNIVYDSEYEEGNRIGHGNLENDSYFYDVDRYM